MSVLTVGCRPSALIISGDRYLNKLVEGALVSNVHIQQTCWPPNQRPRTVYISQRHHQNQCSYNLINLIVIQNYTTSYNQSSTNNNIKTCGKRFIYECCNYSLYCNDIHGCISDTHVFLFYLKVQL